MTIGIVLVALLAATVAGAPIVTSTSILRSTKSATKARKAIQPPFSVAVINDNGFSLYESSSREPLPKCLDEVLTPGRKHRRQF